MDQLPYADVVGTELLQGDLLRRSEALDKVLRSYHPHYFSRPENEYFLVLTQSCDMVKGREGSGCKAPYITICAVRALQVAFDRELSPHVTELVKGIRYASTRARNKVDMFLQRLINNNEEAYFFLRAEPGRAIAKDYCAFLRLAVPIKSSEHYETCAAARVVSLDPQFQAKLGWLLGDLFSRVGTTDWEPKKLTAKVSGISKSAAFWIDEKQIPDFEAELKQWRESHPGLNPSVPDLERMVRGLPNRKKKVISRVRELIEQSEILKPLLDEGHLTPERLKSLGDYLERDAALTTHLR
jgi:hypothetical protein